MSGKRPTDHLEPNAKRRSDRQLTKDDESDEEQAVDPGNFSRASEDVLKQRKIVRARRGAAPAGGDAAAKANPFAGIQLTGAAPAPAANPFAGVSLLGGAAAPAATPAPTPAKAAPAEGQEQPAATEQPAAVEAKQEAAAPAAAKAAQQPVDAAPAAEQQVADESKATPAEQAKPAAEEKPATEAAKPTGGFGGLGSTSGLAFGSSGFGAASGGFGSLASSSGAAFSFGAAPAASSAASIFSFSTAAAPAFSVGGASSAAAAGGDAAGAAAAAAPGGTSLFGATPASGTPLFGAAQAAPPKVELPEEQAVQTGEEDERTVFSGEGALFEFDASKQWRERGRGEMRLNVAPSGQARLVMRQKGNLRLLLNANLWAEMQVSKMEGGKGVTFACVNAAAPAEEASKPAESDAAGEGAAAAAAAATSPHLATFALRIKAPEVLEAFVAAVNQHKAGGSVKAADAAALHITDASLAASRDGSLALPLEAGLQEVDVELGQSLAGSELLVRLSEWLGRAIAASRGTLTSIRLTGPLHLGAIFQAMAPVAQQFMRLEQVYLAKGSEDWQPTVAAAVLRQLPALQRLQFRFSFDDEQTPQDLVGLLLHAQQAARLPPMAGVPQSSPPPILQQLRHLALIFPPRSVIPPTANLPDCLSTLTQLTSLKLKRYPMLSVPSWLGALAGLRYLLWDPALPADSQYTFPPGLGQLTNLRFLWLVHQVPLVLPTCLAPTLEGLHVMARGLNEDTRWLQHWGWLQPFSRLNSMRLQGVGLTELPHELLDKSQLTRLDLMVNQLEDLPEGPYLANMRCMHLGNNHFQRFPSALLTANKLEAVYLANQSGGGWGGGSGRSSPSSVSSSGSQARPGPGATQRLVLYDTDVDGLRHLPCLRTVVMNNMQPQVVVGSQRHDFTWLQRVLKQRGMRLTSNELAYELQSKEVFDLKPLRAALDAAASASGSCSLETNGAQLSWGSDGMSPAAGSERSEQGGL